MADRRRWLRWAAIVAVVAALAHAAVIVLLPRALMEVSHYLVSRRAPVNTLYHGEPITAQNEIVVRSSPDIIYSIGAFDLSDGPLRVAAPLTGAYMSLSCYQMNTDCFFVRNDRQVEEPGFDLVLYGPHHDPPLNAPGERVQSPTNRGILLFRNFIGDGARMQAIEAARLRATIAPLEHGDSGRGIQQTP